MPYGDLGRQRAQRFASKADISAAECTAEEREEYESHVAAGSVVFAPLFEEVVFRGILFATLRSALRPGSAIVLSGAIFGVAHGYGALGFLDVASSGMLWAWAFERTGSVLPGMAAHAVTNLMVTITVLVLLR